MQRNSQYLIISQSGRALAISARRAGIETHVIDLFADEDTLENTQSVKTVTGFSGGNNPGALIDTVAEYITIFPDLAIVIGSGLEDCPDLLAQLEQRYRVIANRSTIVRQLKDPAVFFKRLEELALPYPEYLMTCPESTKGTFVIKTIGGAGGSHVKLFEDGMTLAPGCYLQAFLQGRAYSVTFLADGESFNVLGFNETLVCDENSNFTFAGAVSNTRLPHDLRQQLSGAIRQLVPLYGLRGLCSLDFVVEDTGEYSILEVNPRPTATFELYETDKSLFTQHLAAFAGILAKPEPVTIEDHSRALGILYAGNNITIPLLEWPDWITDRPRTGKQIASGEPVCTIHAAASSPGETKTLLAQRLTMLKKILGLGKIAA